MANKEYSKKDYNQITADDIADLNETFGELFYASGYALKIIEHDKYMILHDARKWGWSDTEVRENVYSLMESLGVDSVHYLG